MNTHVASYGGRRKRSVARDSNRKRTRKRTSRRKVKSERVDEEKTGWKIKRKRFRESGV